MFGLQDKVITLKKILFSELIKHNTCNINWFSQKFYETFYV